MTNIHNIKLSDITIADEYLTGLDPKRCKNALWSAYNVLKKMKDVSAEKRVCWVLFVICKNSEYVHDTNTLRYTAANWDFPPEQFHYEVEDYGFHYSDFVFTDNYNPKGKPKLARAKHFTLSYTADDYPDVIFGLKLFADICQKHTWPFFENADIRIVSKNAAELGLPLGQRVSDATVKELCEYYFSGTIKNGMVRLLKLADELNIRNRMVSGGSYTFSYKGHNIFNFEIQGTSHHDKMNSLNFAIRLVIGHKETGKNFFNTLPTELKAEFLSNPTAHCGRCSGCNWLISVENAGKTYQLCTCNFNYRCHTPTEEQFDMYELFIKLKKEFIDAQKAIKPVVKKEKKPAKAKRDENSVFELTGKQQALIKPKIEDCADYFLQDKTLRKTLTRLVELSQALCEAPKWRAKNRYDSRYKKRDLIKFRFEGLDEFNVTVLHDAWRESTQDKIDFIQKLPEATKKKYLGIDQAYCKQMYCNSNRDSCASTFEGMCYWYNYTFRNPRPEQIKDIEFLAELMKDYIDCK